MSGTSNPQSQVRPAVQAAAYAVGASIGGLLVFPYIASVSGGAAIVQGASVTFVSGVIPTMASPTASTITDRTAVAIAAADLAKVIGVLHLTDTTLLGASAPSVVQATTAVMPFDLPTGTSLYAALIARSGVTLGSTTDVTISLNVIWG